MRTWKTSSKFSVLTCQNFKGPSQDAKMSSPRLDLKCEGSLKEIAVAEIYSSFAKILSQHVDRYMEDLQL